jgi:ABC-type Fe3+/spermidine/putrescine transport system ATPase subunit
LLEDDAGASANSLAGIVDDLAFRGSDTLYRVRLESGTILRVVASNSGNRDAYRPGDRVRVQIPPDACIPLSH